VRERGHHEAASDFVRGIVDLSAPILKDGIAVAALVVPFVHSSPLVKEMPEAVEFVRAAARQLSQELAHGDAA
jgi:DNA-binding IclR family transcriptional regulator